MNSVLKEDPNYLEALISRGNIYTELKKWENAKLDYELVIRLSPKCASAYAGLGDCEANLGYIKEAIKAFNNAIAYNPEAPLSSN